MKNSEDQNDMDKLSPEEQRDYYENGPDIDDL